MSYKLQVEKPKALRFLSVEGSYSQLILFEIDKYNLGISFPDSVLPFPGMNYKTKINFENKDYYIHKVSKSDSSIVRKIITMLNDATWMEECKDKFVLKNELNELTRSTQMEDGIGEFEIILYEYSPKFLIIVGAPENYHKFPKQLQKYQDYKYKVNGQSINVHGIAKSNKLVIEELEKIFGQFQNLYIYNDNSTPINIPIQSNIINSVPAPILLPPKEKTIEEDALSLFSKLKLNDKLIIKELIGDTAIIYGNEKDVNDKYSSDYNDYSILMEVKSLNNKLIFLKLQEI